MNSCSHCKQGLLLIEDCHCRNYKVWDIEGDEQNAKTIKFARSFQDAAETFMEQRSRWDTPEDGSITELFVKNYRGELKKMNVMAEISVSFNAEEEEFSEQEVSA